MKLFVGLLAIAMALAHAPAAFSFDGIRVTLLAAADSTTRRTSTALIEASDEIVLIDCGQGIGERLSKRGMAPSDISAIFLTDLQPRHTAGCRELWQAAGRSGSALVAPVWGPRGTRAFVQQLDSEAGIAEDARTVAFDIVDNVVYQPQGLTVTAFVAGAQRFGYRIDANRRSVAVAGGGAFNENVARNARQSHLLLQELGSPAVERGPEESSTGSSPEEAGKLFRAARPYLAVYLNVMSDEAAIEDIVRRTRRTYSGPVEMARDMMVIEIQNEVQVRGSPSPGN